MRNLLIFILALSIAGCDVKNKKELALQDSLKILQKQTAYAPLPANEAYDFMNRYYLPRLDTLSTGRIILINPLKGTDFKAAYQFCKSLLKEDKSVLAPNKVFLRVPDFRSDTSYYWNVKKLQKTMVIIDSMSIQLANLPHHVSRTYLSLWLKAWRKKYGRGYMMVSYPQYNPYTNRLLIKEWLENKDACGTGRDNQFVFKKIANGWELIN